MTIISYTIVKPLRGKRAQTEDRARQLGAIYARHTAAVRAVNIVAGGNAGCIGLMRASPDMITGAAAYQAIQADPAHAKFWEEAGADPSADIIVGRDVIRTVAGDTHWETHPVLATRRYEVSRGQLSDILALMPEVSALVEGADIKVTATTPLLGADLSAMTVAYQCRSVEDWAKGVDDLSANEAFRSIVARASQFGTLRSSSLMLPLD